MLRNKRILLVGIVSLAFLGISAAGWFLFGDIILIFSLAGMVALLLTIQLESHHRIQQNLVEQKRQQAHNYKQIEALFSIFSLLRINRPLPSMHDFAASPDLISIILSLIQNEKPKLIVEAGSGASTVVAAYCLKELGEGRIISLEDQKQYAEKSMEDLRKHDLQDVATVIHAPLREIKVKDETFLWYDISQLEGIQDIDLLIIDGPLQYGKQEKLVRYPALPILFQSLSNNSVIILDDCFRADEKKIAELWTKEFSLKFEKINTQKGTIILRKNAEVQKLELNSAQYV